MELTYFDKGEYFRGLLILIGKDLVIDDSERKRILEIGKNLGFERKFCEDAVNNYLENNYINKKPPQFSDSFIARKFLTDAIKLSFIDDELHTEELEWLDKVAVENSIEPVWLDTSIKKIVQQHKPQKIENDLI